MRWLIAFANAAVGACLAVGVYFAYCSLVDERPERSAWIPIAITAFLLLANKFFRK